MYSKQEASLIRKRFWETTGQYLAPMPSASLDKVNWINYKTGVRFISFRLHADENMASIAVEISHPDTLKRDFYYNQFLGLKKQLPGIWGWETGSQHGPNRIYAELYDINIYKQETWPQIISFFKERILQLDAFWVEYKEMFEMLD